jgi:NAD(P)-dependent dehydrogenase (short-subunit alcohol dehydrogenase family)
MRAMEIRDRVAVVTGGASGIGEALARRFHADGARHVVVVDRDAAGAQRVAKEIGGTGVSLDVSDEDAIRALVADSERDVGPIDLFVSNAGFVTIGGLEAPNEELQRMWEVHVLAHLYAARAVVPGMIERGGGTLLNTASAAGLLSQIGSLHYAVTKHAAVAFSEWVAMTYGDQGIRVSVLCPQAVETRIGENSPSRDRMEGAGNSAAVDGVIQPTDVADCVTEALREERFWVLPHPEVAEYARRKANDVDRWLAGMRRFQGRLFPKGHSPGDWLASR